MMRKVLVRGFRLGTLKLSCLAASDTSDWGYDDMMALE